MRIADLGSLAVWRGDPEAQTVVEIGGPKPRALLGILALQGGRPTSAERLAEMVWPDRPAAAALPSLQTYVAKLRQVLEPGRAARSPATVLVTSPAGYALQLGPDEIDSRRFTTGVQAVHGRLSRPTSGVPTVPAAMSDRTAGELRTRLERLLDLWRDTPFLDLPDDDLVLAERTRLEGLRLLAVEDLALLRMAAGEDAPVADALLPLLADHPVRESLWALAALALARAGRQSEALDITRRIRTALAEELGIDPGPVLQDVETAVLRQDDRIHWRVTVQAGPSSVPNGTDAATTADGPDTAAAIRSGVTRPTDVTITEIGTATGSLTAPSNGRAAPATPRGDTGDQAWPMVGRLAELAELDGVLRRAAAGQPAIAQLVGEAGIGKSRLMAESAGRARAAGMVVCSATCSADTGAPPLWPWSQLLEQLDAATPPEGDGPAGGPARPLLDPDLLVATAHRGADPGDEGTRFRWWEAVRPGWRRRPPGHRWC